MAKFPRISASLFESYPPALIARWCRVSLKTAKLYKAGARHPPPSVVELFRLNREGLILGPEWQAWKVDRDQLVDPDGCTLPLNILRAYQFILQWVANAAAGNSAAQAEYYRLLGIPETLARLQRQAGHDVFRGRGALSSPNLLGFGDGGQAPGQGAQLTFQGQRRAMEGPPQKEIRSSRGPQGRPPSSGRSEAKAGMEASEGGRRRPPQAAEPAPAPKLVEATLTDQQLKRYRTRPRRLLDQSLRVRGRGGEGGGKVMSPLGAR